MGAGAAVNGDQCGGKNNDQCPALAQDVITHGHTENTCRNRDNSDETEQGKKRDGAAIQVHARSDMLILRGWGMMETIVVSRADGPYDNTDI